MSEMFAITALNNLFYLTFWTIILAGAVMGGYLAAAPSLITTSRMRTIVLLVMLLMFIGVIIAEVLVGYVIYLDGLTR